MNVRQGDHVCFTDPTDPESAYHPISQIRQGQASVYLGRTHRLVPITELAETSKVGSITYYRWDPLRATVATPVEETSHTWKFDFRIDGWSAVKTVSHVSEDQARQKAVNQLARDLNRTAQAVNGMLKRGGNRVIVKEVFN